MEFNDKIKMLRLQQGSTLDDIATIVGVSRATVQRWESGEIANIRRDKIWKLSKALHTSPSYLMGWTDDPEVTISSDVKNILPLPGTKKKPRLGAIACGQPILAAGEDGEYDDVPEDVECDFTLVCKGDSMINARIFDGDIVYIRSQPKVENGQIAAVRIGDEATLKKVYYTPGSDRLVLRACNPLYPDMVYEGPQLELEQVEIIGLAVGFYSEIRHDM